MYIKIDKYFLIQYLLNLNKKEISTIFIRVNNYNEKMQIKFRINEKHKIYH